MKHKKFWNEDEITEACKEVELARKVLKEVSKVTKKHEIPAEYILDVCNSQWVLIKEIAKGLAFEDRDEADYWDNNLSGLNTNDEEQRKIYNQWRFIDELDYNIRQFNDIRNLQVLIEANITGADLFK